MQLSIIKIVEERIKHSSGSICKTHSTCFNRIKEILNIINPLWKYNIIPTSTLSDIQMHHENTLYTIINCRQRLYIHMKSLMKWLVNKEKKTLPFPHEIGSKDLVRVKADLLFNANPKKEVGVVDKWLWSLQIILFWSNSILVQYVILRVTVVFLCSF